MNVEALYKERIEALWNEYRDKPLESFEKEIVNRGFAIETELPHNDVLFIGMNPAYDIRRDKPGDIFYNVSEKGNDFFNAIVNFSDKTRQCKNPSHHDLLFIRHTRQKDIEAQLNGGPLKEFLNIQLDMSVEIIRELSPQLIVILNAGACRLFETKFDRVSDRRIEEDLGAYPFLINKVTPVLFSSMLSGQRPLDTGSKNSLSWHINYILKNLR